MYVLVFYKGNEESSQFLPITYCMKESNIATAKYFLMIQDLHILYPPYRLGRVHLNVYIHPKDQCYCEKFHPV